MASDEAGMQRFDTVTEDLGEIDALTRQMFGASVRVERSDGRPPSLRLAQSGFSDFAVQRVTWNVDGHCDVAPLRRFLCIRLRRGAYGLDQGDGQVMYATGDTFLADPRRRVNAEVVGADLDSFTIELPMLERIASRISPWSDGRLDYSRATPVTPQLSRAWDAVLDQTSAVLRSDEPAAESPLVRASLAHLLASTACAAFQLLPERRVERPASERSVRRAMAFVDEHLAEPLTVAEMAEAAGLSVRGLQAAFQRVVGSAPLTYLHRARLDAARRDLLAAGPGTTVAEVARRWGFLHLGRFSGSYREAFGELPSTTLRS